jgi:23S rRNA (adenine2030-N6)-methyltransferase
MNYRHAYHAGNFADVLKHAVLVALLEALKTKATPFCYIDTHAGSGRYDLKSREARKTGEAEDGVGLLKAASGLPPVLWTWLEAVRALNEGSDSLRFYPGSPLIAARLMRPQDSAQLCELQPDEATALRALLHDDPRMHVHQRDGYEALNALVPPKEKRGLVLIDPPFEAQDAEFRLIEKTLKQALLRWPTGVYAIWYPIKLRSHVHPFHRWLQRCGAKRVLVAEVLLHSDNTPLRLNGAGVAIINAPWKLDEPIREVLKILPRLFNKDAAPAKENGAEYKLHWLVDDKDGAAEPVVHSPYPTRSPKRR